MSISRNNRPLLVALVAAAVWLAVPPTTSAAPAKPAAPQSSVSAQPEAPGTKRLAAPHVPSSEERNARLERYRKWVRDSRDRRDIHRKARLKRLRYRLKRVLRGAPITEEIRVELARHARLRARLDRIKEVAIEQQDVRTIGQVESELRKEDGRHNRWMSSRQVRDPKAVSSSAPAARGEKTTQ